MQMTLVLDVGYQPLNLVTCGRAVRYVVNGKVEVLEQYGDYPIHPDWQAPAVVRLMHWIQPHRRRVRFSRQNVLARDRWTCQYCGNRRPTRELTFDHVVPRCQGGLTSWTNIVMACRDPCNTTKGGRTPQQAGMVCSGSPSGPGGSPASISPSRAS